MLRLVVARDFENDYERDQRWQCGSCRGGYGVEIDMTTHRREK